MDMDLEPITLLIAGGFWVFILVLVWAVPFGLSRIRDKIIFSILALPCIYGIVVWQKGK